MASKGATQERYFKKKDKLAATFSFPNVSEEAAPNGIKVDKLEQSNTDKQTWTLSAGVMQQSNST